LRAGNKVCTHVRHRREIPSAAGGGTGQHGRAALRQCQARLELADRAGVAPAFESVRRKALRPCRRPSGDQIGGSQNDHLVWVLKSKVEDATLSVSACLNFTKILLWVCEAALAVAAGEERSRREEGGEEFNVRYGKDTACATKVPTMFRLVCLWLVFCIVLQPHLQSLETAKIVV
jgi:hypothetical protein